MKHATALLLLLSACTLAPDTPPPEVPAPDWRGAESTETLPEKDWWQEFKNEELQTLLAEALEQNNDLRASLARIAQARASAQVSAAPLLPSVEIGASAGRTYPQLFHGGYAYNDTYRAGPQASYVLDLFGRNRSNALAAWLGAEASAHDREALVLLVQSDTAQAFLSYLALKDRQDVAEKNLAISRDVLDITRQRFEVGTLSAIELAQQETAYANAQASLASLVQQREVALNQLAVLLGRPPQDMAVKSESLRDVALPAIAPIQPAQLIARRPDILAAEAQLAAANYNIGAARAAFLPTLSVSANTVLSASTGGTPTALAASLLQPIFRGGALTGALEISEARRTELEEQYTKTVLTAFQEVQNALAAQTAASERVTRFAHAAGQAEKAYTLARQRFDVGTIDFLTLLDTQNRQLSAQDSLITARQAELAAAIDLFTALGGGAFGTTPQ